MNKQASERAGIEHSSLLNFNDSWNDSFTLLPPKQSLSTVVRCCLTLTRNTRKESNRQQHNDVMKKVLNNNPYNVSLAAICMYFTFSLGELISFFFGKIIKHECKRQRTRTTARQSAETEKFAIETELEKEHKWDGFAIVFYNKETSKWRERHRDSNIRDIPFKRDGNRSKENEMSTRKKTDKEEEERQRDRQQWEWCQNNAKAQKLIQFSCFRVTFLHLHRPLSEWHCREPCPTAVFMLFDDGSKKNCCIVVATQEKKKSGSLLKTNESHGMQPIPHCQANSCNNNNKKTPTSTRHKCEQ